VLPFRSLFVRTRSPRREGQLDHALRRINTLIVVPAQIGLLVRPDGR